ncbi:NHL repeat-containing protein [Variovorax sp. 770b2]|uniref:NHL repeat-containing protein n=1 Tax=Variovorax sp. 770b2 TaxID=1566271 RepID=UPI0008EB5791|nr:NHL repeat-containing protein [Variovorax sp. 770b2]SFP28692.1 NHL repeat-containing protein [Variovorax sp. 770b2]
MTSQMNFYGRRGAVAAAIALLASCGGGGNGGSGFFPITAPAPVQPVVTPVVAKHTVSGTVTGLVGNLVLQSNAGDDLTLTADGKFTFATGIAEGSTYAVSVRTQPFWQFCAVTRGSGTVTADVGDVTVACSAAVGQVSTLAGSGAIGALDGNGTAATFADPYGIVIDKNGGLIVSDVARNRVRKIAANGDVTTFAGNNTTATVDGNGTAASFNNLAAIALAPSGDLYVAEFSGNRIRKITPAADVTTFVGTGAGGSVDGNAANATFTGPIAMTLDGAGNIYLAELNTSLIRKITPAGDVTTLAGSGGFGFAEGTGAAASFARPYGIAADAAGNLFVADSDNNRIRKVTQAGVVTTFAGSGAAGAADGAAASATFQRPGGVAFDPAGNLYVADTGNSILRKITPEGVVSTVAGQAGVMGSQNGIGSAARFSEPSGVAVGADGTVYVADTLGNRIRKIAPVGAP